MDEITHKKNFKPINIRDLFNDKSPSVARWIPGFVYRILSRMLGIRTNLEIFFLPNESYKHMNKHFVITFGTPIPYETFDNRYTPHEWAQLVKDHTYLIAGDHQRKFSYLKHQNIPI